MPSRADCFSGFWIAVSSSPTGSYQAYSHRSCLEIDQWNAASMGVFPYPQKML